MFTMTVKQDPVSQQTLSDLQQALKLLHLPAAAELWQRWVDEGKLVIQEREDGELYWKWNGNAPSVQGQR